MTQNVLGNQKLRKGCGKEENVLLILKQDPEVTNQTRILNQEAISVIY